MAEGNYASINRKLIESDLWLSEKFTRGQAWVDLVLLANYKPGYFRVRGIRVDVDRGQVGRSELALSERWGWSRGKVKRFLTELENDHRIVQQKTRVTTLIYIVNYEKYQKSSTTNGTTDSTTDGTTENGKNAQNQQKSEHGTVQQKSNVSVLNCKGNSETSQKNGTTDDTTDSTTDGTTDGTHIIRNNNNNNKDKDICGDNATGDPKPKKRTRFVKPTPEQVQAYMDEKQYTELNGQRFFDHYESNGWMVGKTPMKDWKAAVRNWERMRKERGINRNSNQSPAHSGLTTKNYGDGSDGFIK